MNSSNIWSEPTQYPAPVILMTGAFMVADSDPRYLYRARTRPGSLTCCYADTAAMRCSPTVSFRLPYMIIVTLFS